MTKLKTSQILPTRVTLLEAQQYTCPLCLKSMKGSGAKKPALDHDHKTGYIRDVLCINCNGMEGKVFNLATRGGGSGQGHEWLRRLVAYLDLHSTPQHGGLIHPTHKTELEKRLARNAKARKARAKAKG